MEGIDIYETTKGNISFHGSLIDKDFGFEEGSFNAMDVNSNDESSLLYVLDYERGLIVVNITDLKNVVII
jgi:hypothetical protein